ncbi:hypothetical protein L917_16972 [Phytophthora nicotianae]|uniref:Transposase IS204/IS1001/IS1096/IS1165 DDE domain-containing protein n=1 Tax=Phytophthora nicotianae TaxID=4792 RepID=W2KCM1_PHYNI|nr:hypothetical protein L917_16972 [Phytophthora nicotianae]
MGRALTRSENHAETETVLRALIEKLKPGVESTRVCICDNPNANRNLAQKVFGEAVAVKQDPFHVIQRFTEKVRELAKRKWLAGELSAAIYDIERNLRAPRDMEVRVQKVLASISQSSVNVKEAEWKVCIASNLEQIRRGDMYLSDNQYVDEGGSTRIISTSQLEAIHSK